MGDILKTEIIDTVELAKNLVQGIIKAKKVIKMYPANNPIYTKSIEDTYAKFKKFLDFYNTLFFRIHQNEILFNNEQVYYNSEKEDNLALFLFKDGVRDVTFLRGFDQNELEDFMKILNTDFENLALEDDIVTLLWERDFEHIKYTAADEFLYDEDHEKKYEEIKGSSCTEENLNRAYEDGLKAKAVDATPAIPITDDDLKRIEEYIENEETRPKIDKIIAIIFELLQQSKEEDILPEIAGFIEQTLAYCIRSGYFNKAVFVLDSLKPLLKENIGAENIKSLRRIYTTINSQPFIDELGAVLNSGTDIEEDGFAAFSKYLDKNTIPLFIKLLGEISSIRGRRHIIEVLFIVGRLDIRTLANGLYDEKWYVVRNIIIVLGKIADSQALEYLIKILSHTDERVRKETIKAFAGFRSADTLPHLKNALKDKAPTVRITAARTLGVLKTPPAKKILLDELSAGNFSSADFMEKKELFGALSSWQDDEVKDFLLKTLKRNKFWKKKNDETRACAAFTLGMIGCREAVPILEKTINSKNILLKKHSQAALQQLKV